MVCSDTYMLGSRGHGLWLGVYAGEQEPCFLVASTQAERASEDGHTCAEAFRQAGGLLVKAWHCFCSMCHCFCNLSVCDPCISVHNWVYLPSGYTYLCMMLSAPFFCVLCCLCVGTICVVSHLHPRLSWIMSCSLDSGYAGQSCVWDLCGRVLVSEPQLAILPVPNVLGNCWKSESLPLSYSSKTGSRKQETPELGFTAQVLVPMSACGCLCKSGC